MNKDYPIKWNKKLWVSAFCTALEGLLSGSNFMLMYYLFQRLWQQKLDFKELLSLTGILVGIFVVRLIIYSFGYVQGQIGGAGVSKAIRLFLGDKLKRIPISRFQKANTGDYINVATENVNSYEKVLTHKIGDIIKNLTLICMLIIFVGTMSISASVILLAAAILFIPSIAISLRAVRKYGVQKNAICTESVSSIVEYIGGIQTFRAYGIGGVKNKTVTKAMKAYSDISYQYEVKVIPDGAIYGILSWMTLPLEMIVVGNQWMSGEIQTVSYIMICMLPLFFTKLLSTVFVDITSYKNLMIAREKINKVIEEKEEIVSEKKFNPSCFDISFKDVNFSYVPDEPVIKNLSIQIEDKQLTAIVGDSGSGKSTLLNLISKYYEPTQGNIKIGGQDISQLGANEVLAHIAMVDQDVFLFDDTIRNNIRYARPSATDAEIEAACKTANCEEFISCLPNGYETMTGENGNQLSGGERQRLSIARAILKDAPIILLDEATANLDIENELAVKKAIKNLLSKKKTVIMIAHTLSIVQHADKIIVISKGKVMEEGTHETLLRKNGKYAAMWKAEKNL